MYDVLIIGGGVSGMQCALILGSALKKPYAKEKKVGIILHQKASHLQTALFNNVLGLEKEKRGSDILSFGKTQLQENYPEVEIITSEKVISIDEITNGFVVNTNKNKYYTRIGVIALNYAKPFTISGLENYLEPHKKSPKSKDRIQLKNTDHLVQKNLYVCGTLAGHPSQFAIAAGSGASVATDILTLWNNGIFTKVHDKI